MRVVRELVFDHEIIQYVVEFFKNMLLFSYVWQILCPQ